MQRVRRRGAPLHPRDARAGAASAARKVVIIYTGEFGDNMNNRRLRWGLLAIIASLIVLGWVVFRRDAAAPLVTEKSDHESAAPASAPTP